MHDSSLSPPALYHSPLSGDEGGREPSTSESTPLHTPKTVAAELHQPVKQQQRARDLYFAWHKKQELPRRDDAVFLSEADWDRPGQPLFESDFSLFPDSPPTFEKRNMGTTFEQRNTDAIDINLPPRLSNSQSPRNQTSTLTAQLEQAGASGQHVPENNMQYMGVPEPGRLSVSGRHDSMSNMFGGGSSYYGSGARPISMKDRQRRESNTGGGSFMGGMSWGGISVGSLRDE